MNPVVWGPIGKTFDNPISAHEAINQCNANFTVGLQPIAALTPEIMDMINRGENISPDILSGAIMNGNKATMRLDNNTPLGLVSENYGIVQNEHAFDFVDKLTTGMTGSDTPIITDAGSIFGGRKTFITAKFPEPIRLAGKDDIIDMYCVFVTSHDGTGAVTCMMTPIRVWCNNMINLASRSCASKISFRHTRFVAERLDLENKENAIRAYKALNLYSTYREFFQAKVDELSAKTITDKEMTDIVARISLPDDSYEVFKKVGTLYHDDISTRARNLAMGIMDSIHSGVGQQGTREGTAMWVLNGITTHFQNHTDWKNKDDKKFDSITEGNVFHKMQSAFELLDVA